jgi:hypothetical protein
MTDQSSPADTVGHHSGTEYVLTTSLGHALDAFKRLELRPPSASFVEDVETKLRQSVDRALTGTGFSVVSIPFADLCDSLAARVHEMRQRHPDARVVSTAPLVTYDTGGLCLQINRVVDMDGKILGISGRPGHPILSSQVRRLAAALGGQRVIIVEDGSFTGATLCQTLQELKTCGVHVVAIVMGILFPEAAKTIAQNFEGEVLCSHRLENPVDWMPTHDFFPFVPNCGRVVGISVQSSLHALHTPTGGNLSMPYILPYANPADWASIPAGLAAHQFSVECLKLTRGIFAEIERINGRQVRFCDLLGCYPAVGYPVIRGGSFKEFPNVDVRILDVLDGDLEMLS